MQAQTSMPGGFRLTGKVVDVATGEGLQGALVKVVNGEGFWLTDAKGGFSFLLPPGVSGWSFLSAINRQQNTLLNADKDLLFCLTPLSYHLQDITVLPKARHNEKSRNEYRTGRC